MNRLGLETREVFLDTEVYVRNRLSLDTPTLVVLKEYIDRSVFCLHITDITESEVSSHLEVEAEKSGTVVEQANRSLERWAERCGKAAKKIDFDPKDVARHASEGFKATLLMEWGADHHDASSRSGEDIFADYFARRPPFHEKESKEFPDAFIIAALADWCEQNSKKMYVVSGDHAFLRAAEATEVLLPIKELPGLLQLAAAADTPDIIKIAQDLIGSEAFVAAVTHQIDAAVDHLGYVYIGDRSEGEVLFGVRAGSVDLVDVHVLSATSDEISLLQDIEVPMRLSIAYDDRTKTVYDREDGVRIGAQYVVDEIDETAVLRMVLVVNRVTGELLRSEFVTQDVFVYDKARR